MTRDASASSTRRSHARTHAKTRVGPSKTQRLLWRHLGHARTMASSASASSSVPPAPIFRDDTGDPAEARKCRDLVGKAFASCPKVRLMQQALSALGKSVNTELVKCVHCPDGTAAAGGYIPERGQVVLCQQWVAKQPGEVENTIVHEMVHAYDDARALMDWNDLTQHACTEIRAANLSGDCTAWRELDRGQLNPVQLGGAGMRCVRRRAQLSVAMHPECPDEAAAAAAVERAWESCYNDNAPFDQHARSKQQDPS
jgi:inner membrane protease ATP23